MNVNLGCGPFLAPKPWVNVDVIYIPKVITPSVVVKPGEPLPWNDEVADRVYLGHMLEHVEWADVSALLADVRRILCEGGEVCVVGPDVNRTLQRWHDGDENWQQVLGVIEDDLHYQEAQAEWAGARHAWNCNEGRVMRALTAAGFRDVQPLPITEEALAEWPVVAFTQHQCAVRAVR